MALKSRSKSKLYHLGPPTGEYIYIVTGDNKAHVQIRKIPITLEDDKYVYTKRKRYRKKDVPGGIGQHHDWEYRTLLESDAYQHKIDHLEYLVESNTTMIAFLKYERKRDFKRLLKKIYKSWGVQDIAKEEKKRIYSEFSPRFNKAIEKCIAIKAKAHKVLAKLKE